MRFTNAYAKSSLFNVISSMFDLFDEVYFSFEALCSFKKVFNIDITSVREGKFSIVITGFNVEVVIIYNYS
jgi:hypothetical protein